MDDRSQHLVRRVHGQTTAKSRSIRHRTRLHTRRNGPKQTRGTAREHVQEPDPPIRQRDHLLLHPRPRHHPDPRRPAHLHQPSPPKCRPITPEMAEMEATQEPTVDRGREVAAPETGVRGGGARPLERRRRFRARDEEG